jgi:type IV secretory pathway protease TraF
MAAASPPRMQWRHLALLAIAVIAVLAGAAISMHGRPLIIYNPSQSAPQGFYVRRDGPPQVGDFVTIAAVNAAANYAAARGFTDRTDRFIKRVAATTGQTVCADGARISIDGRSAATRAEYDSSGRALPTWSGCRTLSEDEVFLLGDTDDSFDGRYWGPTPLSHIDGVWTRL